MSNIEVMSNVVQTKRGHPYLQEFQEQRSKQCDVSPLDGWILTA